MHALAGFEPALSWSEVSAPFTTDKMFPGERSIRLMGRFAVEEVRIFTTWNSKTLLASLMKAAVGLETKNPSGALAREGFVKRTLRNDISSFRLRETVRAHKSPARMGCGFWDAM